jgi:hypothetical protein
MDSLYSYTAIKSQPEYNYTYLSNTHATIVGLPDNSFVGLMMILSIFQFGSQSVNPIYSNATSQMGRAAYIVSGGQTAQDKLSTVITRKAFDVIHSVNITDSEIGVVLGTMKIARERKIDINGPRLGIFRSHVTLTPNAGNIGLKYEW